jgi:hypothetical protein
MKWRSNKMDGKETDIPVFLLPPSPYFMGHSADTLRDSNPEIVMLGELDQGRYDLVTFVGGGQPDARYAGRSKEELTRIVSNHVKNHAYPIFYVAPAPSRREVFRDEMAKLSGQPKVDLPLVSEESFIPPHRVAKVILYNPSRFSDGALPVARNNSRPVYLGGAD